jgi:hypothetical protein
MKTAIIAIAFTMFGLSAFAQDTAKPAEPVKVAAASNTASKAMGKKEAHKACKAEGKKGADFKACVKEKTGK